MQGQLHTLAEQEFEMRPVFKYGLRNLYRLHADLELNPEESCHKKFLCMHQDYSFIIILFSIKASHDNPKYNIKKPQYT